MDIFVWEVWVDIEKRLHRRKETSRGNLRDMNVTFLKIFSTMFRCVGGRAGHGEGHCMEVHLCNSRSLT